MLLALLARLVLDASEERRLGWGLGGFGLGSVGRGLLALLGVAWAGSIVFDFGLGSLQGVIIYCRHP